MKFTFAFACIALFAAPVCAFDDIRPVTPSFVAPAPTFSVAMSKWRVWSVMSVRPLPIDIQFQGHASDMPEEEVSTRLHWAVRPRFGLAWDWQDRDDVLDLDDVTLGVSVRFRF